MQETVIEICLKTCKNIKNNNRKTMENQEIFFFSAEHKKYWILVMFRLIRENYVKLNPQFT